MHLPTFPRSMAAVRHVQTAFGGYDHRPACPEGGIYEMINGSAADSPLFATRPGRTLSYPVHRAAERPVCGRGRAALVRGHGAVS